MFEEFNQATGARIAATERQAERLKSEIGRQSAEQADIRRRIEALEQR